MSIKPAVLIGLYLEPMIDYLNNKIDLESFTLYFCDIYFDSSGQLSDFISKTKKIDYLIEDIFSYSINFEEWSELGMTKKEFDETVNELFLLMVKWLRHKSQL